MNPVGLLPGKTDQSPLNTVKRLKHCTYFATSPYFHSSLFFLLTFGKGKWDSGQKSSGNDIWENWGKKKKHTKKTCLCRCEVIKIAKGFFGYWNLLHKVILKRHQDHIKCLFQRRLKLEFLRKQQCQCERLHKKHQRKEKGSGKQLTSIKRLKYFQKQISVVLSHDFVLSEEKKTDWYSAQSVFWSLRLPSPRPLSNLSPSLFFFWWVFLSFCFPSFLFSHFLPLSCAFLTLSVSVTISLRGRLSPEAHRQLTLAVVLFMEAEKYTVTFPAFLLEISNRSGLSIQDRDPGGG